MAGMILQGFLTAFPLHGERMISGRVTLLRQAATEGRIALKKQKQTRQHRDPWDPLRSRFFLQPLDHGLENSSAKSGCQVVS